MQLQYFLFFTYSVCDEKVYGAFFIYFYMEPLIRNWTDHKLPLSKIVPDRVEYLSFISLVAVKEHYWFDNANVIIPNPL